MNKSHLMGQLLQSRIKLDKEHFKNTVDIIQKQSIIVKNLERLALCMEVLGRNIISEDEFEDIIQNAEERSLLRYCSVWISSLEENEQKPVWRFEHNNFQEYLAARVLSTKPLNQIREYISFGPEFLKIKPSWVNTLSFLISITSDKDELFEQLISWLREIKPEVLIKAEPDRIDPKSRFEIFKNIFEYYKEKRLLIDRQDFNVQELGQFADLNESINYLLNILSSETDSSVLDNAIYMLKFMRSASNRRNKCEELLLKIILSDGADNHVISSALLTLADLHLNTRKAIEIVVKRFKDSDDTWIRFALYYHIYTSDYLDEYIDVFIDGLKYIRSGVIYGPEDKDTRLGDEPYHLREGLEQAKSPSAIKKIISYFVVNPEDIHPIYIGERLDRIVTNGISAFSEDETLYVAFADLYVVLLAQYRENEALSLLPFFDETGTRSRLFEKLFADRKNDKDWYTEIGAILNEELTKRVADEYLKGNISENDIWVIRNHIFWKNKNKTEWFLDTIKKLTGREFIIPKTRDFQSERKIRFQEDLQLLFDRDKFIIAIKKIYDEENREKLDNDESHKTRLKRWDDPSFSELALRELQNITEKGVKSFQEVKDIIIKSDWSYFQTYHIYQYLAQKREVDLSTNQWDIIKNWCVEQTNNINFRTALRPNNQNGTTASQLSIIMWYFIRHIKIEYPKRILLDLLSFDWPDGSGYGGIGYIEDRLYEYEITERILENLNEGINVEVVLKNHLEYCGRKRIEEVLPYAVKVVEDGTCSNEIRETAVRTLIVFQKGQEMLRGLVTKIKSEFRWSIFEKTKNIAPDETKHALKEIIKSGSEDQRLRAAYLLIDMQDIDGLNYVVDYVKIKKQGPHLYPQESIFKKMNNPDAVSPLIDLLEATYGSDFVDDSFHSVKNAVLRTLASIAIIHNRYEDIRSRILSIIDKNISQNDEFRNLYYYLNRLENDVLMNKSTNITLKDAIKLVDRIL